MNENRYIELCKHAIGMGMRKPYKRHGKTFYRPYRNRFSATKGTTNFTVWEELESKGYAKSREFHGYGNVTQHGKFFWMTRAGLDWLGEQLNMHIYDEED